MLMSQSMSDSTPLHFVHYQDYSSDQHQTHHHHHHRHQPPAAHHANMTNSAMSSSPSSSSASTTPQQQQQPASASSSPFGSGSSGGKRHKKHDPVDSSPPERKKPFERKGQEKLLHNAAERRRKQKFNGKLTELNDLLPPSGKQSKPSKIRILERAVDYTRQLHAQLAALEEKNRVLQLQLESFQPLPPTASSSSSSSSSSQQHKRKALGSPTTTSTSTTVSSAHQLGIPVDLQSHAAYEIHHHQMQHDLPHHLQQHPQHQQQQQHIQQQHHHQHPQQHMLQQSGRDADAMLSLARASAAMHHSQPHHQHQQQAYHQQQHMQHYQQPHYGQYADPAAHPHPHTMMQSAVMDSPPSSANSPLSTMHHHQQHQHPHHRSGYTMAAATASSPTSSALQMQMSAHLPPSESHTPQLPILPPLRSLQALSLPSPSSLGASSSPLLSGSSAGNTSGPRATYQQSIAYSPPSSPSLSAQPQSGGVMQHAGHHRQQTSSNYAEPGHYPAGAQAWNNRQ